MTSLFTKNTVTIPNKLNSKIQLKISEKSDYKFYKDIDKQSVFDLKNAYYKNIFTTLCIENNEKIDEYNALLKLYQNNYRYVVLLIENEHLKEEVKKLEMSLK